MDSEPVKTESVFNPAPTIRDRLMRHAMARLLTALLVLFVSTPFLRQLESGRLIESSLFSLLMLAAVFVVGGRRRTLAAAIVLAVPGGLGSWALGLFSPGPAFRIFFLAVCA